MAAIEIRSGKASEVSYTGAGIAFRIGDPPISVSIGALPMLATSGMFAPPPIKENEWIAVAVQPTAWLGSGYALLSYRRLGLGGPSRPANFSLAAWLLGLSAFGIAMSLPAKNLSTAIGHAACFVLLAIPCALRLLSVRKATRLLQNWHATV
jgi:hypothetical protein